MLINPEAESFRKSLKPLALLLSCYSNYYVYDLVLLLLSILPEPFHLYVDMSDSADWNSSVWDFAKVGKGCSGLRLESIKKK